MNRTRFVAIGLFAMLAVIVVGGAPVNAGKKDPVAVCKDKKFKAAGKKAVSLLKAFGKNEKKEDGTRLASDLSKAESNLTKSFG